MVASNHKSTLISENQMFVFEPFKIRMKDRSLLTMRSVVTIQMSHHVLALPLSPPIHRLLHPMLSTPHVGSPAQFALSTRALTTQDQAYKLYGPNVKHTYQMNRKWFGNYWRCNNECWSGRCFSSNYIDSYKN